MRFSVRLVLVSVVGVLLSLMSPAHADDPAPAPIAPPSIIGEPAHREVLMAQTGTWAPTPTSLTVEWLRDGAPIATGTTYRTRKRDIGADLSVRVTAAGAGGVTIVDSAAVRIGKARLTSSTAKIKGTPRFGRTLRAVTPRWSRKPHQVRRVWLRNGTPIKGAGGKRHAISHLDVGKRISVRFIAKRANHRKLIVESKQVKARHRVGVRRVVTYSVETRGPVSASVPKFRKLAQQTYDDPRGWRGSGIRFKRVARGGAFTLVLATPDSLPRFSSGCSAEWSCRVGRFVVINQLRWQHASPAWNQRGGTLRGYRHMVVNHETGHWLGHGHRHCPRPGAAAPVMQQQSKGLQGCTFNAWPTAAERRTPRFG